MQRNLCLAALLLPFLSGCLFSRTDANSPIARETVELLEPGKHNAADVVGMLGGPVEVVQLGKRSAYLYDHRTQKVTGLWLIIFGIAGDDVRSDRVWVFFDENNVLTHVGATFEASEAEYELPGLTEDDE
ncbi:MAG: hypothetical protein ACI8QC_002668 [Planctomycetota bacterium]|jgi:hypothetical protein